MPYPKTLIYCGRPSKFYGGGTFLTMLFSKWPRERLASVCNQTYLVDWDVCANDYQMGTKEFPWKEPLQHILPKRFSGPMRPTISSKSNEIDTSKFQIGNLYGKENRIRRFAKAFIQYFLQADTLKTHFLSAELVAWVKAFNPDIIYGFPSNITSNRLLRQLCKVIDRPLMLHYMDDWPENLYKDGLFDRFYRKIYIREFLDLVHFADVNVAICKEMAEEYQRRYNTDFSWLNIPVNMGQFRPFMRSGWEVKKAFHIRYGGRIGWALRQSLLDLAKVVHELRQRGHDVFFDIYSGTGALIADECKRYDGVKVHPLGPYEDLARSLRDADLLFICYDFDNKSFRQARYSMPGKLGECLGTGTPVLVYGPKGLPVVEYARRDGWGYVVDERSHEGLRNAIEILKSTNLRERLGRTCLKLAESHDAGAVSEDLCKLMLPKIQFFRSKARTAFQE